MTEFRKPLLLVTDTCDAGPGLRRAVELSRASGAELTILDVAEPMAHYLQTYLDEDSCARFAKAEEQRRTARLERLAHEAAGSGVRVSTKLATGSLFRTAILEVQDGGHDLLLKTVDTPEPGLRAVHGSLDRHLLRKCPQPLWLEAAAGPAPIRRILAAVNPDPAAPEDQALGVELLQMAGGLARRHGAELHVLHAWKVLGEWTGSPGATSDPELVPLLGQVMNRHLRYLDDALLAAGIATGQARIHLVHHRASLAIIEALQALQPDLLVMGTLGRTGIPGFFIGNTAERVLGEVTCSVLARKPAGFVSPVTRQQQP